MEKRRCNVYSFPYAAWLEKLPCARVKITPRITPPFTSRAGTANRHMDPILLTGEIVGHDDHRLYWKHGSALSPAAQARMVSALGASAETFAEVLRAKQASRRFSWNWRGG